MKQDLSLTALTRGLSRFLHRFHVILFTLVVIGGLAAATLALYEEINTQVDQTSTPTATQFDTATMKKIESLRGPNDPASPLTLPAGRTNPFQE